MSKLGDNILPEINADWAKRMSKEVLSVKVNGQVKLALESVRSAINRDDEYANCPINAHSKTIEILESRGFKVKQHVGLNQLEGDYLTIKW